MTPNKIYRSIIHKLHAETETYMYMYLKSGNLPQHITSEEIYHNLLYLKW